MISDLATWKKVVVVILVIIGLLAVIAGIIYLALPAHSLPHFFPAHSNSLKHGTKHGIAALVIGAIVVIAAIVIIVAGRDRGPA
jgi:archaellum biogenesis protein FlaJ (TadC family)